MFKLLLRIVLASAVIISGCTTKIRYETSYEPEKIKLTVGQEITIYTADQKKSYDIIFNQVENNKILGYATTIRDYVTFEFQYYKIEDQRLVKVPLEQIETISYRADSIESAISIDNTITAEDVGKAAVQATGTVLLCFITVLVICPKDFQ